jgi:hypothetical protein
LAEFGVVWCGVASKKGVPSDGGGMELQMTSPAVKAVLKYVFNLSSEVGMSDHEIGERFLRASCSSAMMSMFHFRKSVFRV